MTDAQGLLIVATVYIAPHLPKGMGLALGLFLLSVATILGIFK